jgi:U3 small nucleolar RNA-associated protein 14
MVKRKSPGNNADRQKGKSSRRQPKLVDHVSDESDDEEIPEDEAFNSEDEKKYGSFFDQKDTNNVGDSDSDDDGSDEFEDDDDMSDDDDSEEGDGGQYMLDLLNQLDDKKTGQVTKGGKSVASKIATHVKENEFAASVVPKSGLTLDSLMNEIKDTKGYGVVQKTMKNVVSGKATAAPVAHVVSERIKRKVHYEEQSSDISQWIEAVQQNRKAETLDFRPKQRLEITRDVLIENFVPTTDFEKQINAALEEAGQEDEEAILRAEEAALQDDLGANEITLEEYKKRHGQLAKMRALMFYHEQKRHHINKIKSKKYRRIRKNQREKQKSAELEGQIEDDPDLEQELAEKEEVDRMKERMTLAHKNTSKWAKRVLKRGKNADVDTRRALSAQLKRGDDLLKRMRSTAKGEGDSDSDDENLIEAARKVLAETEEQGDEQEDSGLFKLAFMKKGIEKQREIAKQEARQLLLELEANEEQISEDDDKELKVRDEQQIGSKMASKKEMNTVLQDGELVATSLRSGNSSAVTMSGTIDVNDLFTNQKEMPSTNVNEHTATFSIVASENQTNRENKKYSNQTASRQSNSILLDTEKEIEKSNPWLPAAEMGIPKSELGKSSDSVNKKSKISGFVDVDSAIDLLEGTQKDPVSGKKVTEKPSGNVQQNITTLTQEELVQKAFATISDQEAEEEFAREKAFVEDDEDPTRKVKKQKEMESVSGWGTWVGDGAPPAKNGRKLPHHLQPPNKKPLPKRKRTDEKRPNVIISQKRCKKMADNYMISQIPHPYTSREEYERAMIGGVGREWNVSSSFKDMTRREIITRPGKIIQPLSKRVKQARAPAKF